MSFKLKAATLAATTLLGMGVAGALAPAAQAATPHSWCGSTNIGNGYYYVFDHAYSSGGHQYLQYSTMYNDGKNWQWNGIYSFQCDGVAAPPNATAPYYYAYDLTYTSSTGTYDQYSVLYLSGSNYQWDGIFSYKR